MRICRSKLIWPIRLKCSEQVDCLAPAVLPQQRTSTLGCSQLTRGTQGRVCLGHGRLELGQLGVNFLHPITAGRSANLELAPNTRVCGPTHYAHIVEASPAHSGRVVTSVRRAFDQRP